MIEKLLFIALVAFAVMAGIEAVADALLFNDVADAMKMATACPADFSADACEAMLAANGGN